MAKSTQNDLRILLASLTPKKETLFLKQTIAKSTDLKTSLLKQHLKKKEFDKSSFIKRNNIDNKKYNSIKFELLRDLIDFIKDNYLKEHKYQIESSLIECEILLKNRLNSKAIQKLEGLLEIAKDRCDFNTCCTILQKNLSYRLFLDDKNPNKINELIKLLKHYQSLARNLMDYELLSIEVLNAHYRYLDRRLEKREVLLTYLNHELISDKSKALSLYATFFFYRIKSIIYLGDNNFQKSRQNSLLAISLLENNTSINRDDSVKLLFTINNYLDASLHFKKYDDFKVMFSKMEKLYSESSESNNRYFKVEYLQLYCSLQLNYFWMTNSVDLFNSKTEKLKNIYWSFHEEIRPNFRLEILLGLARMFFISEDLHQAEEYVDKILEQKSNPASLYYSCATMMKVMINYDLKKFALMPHIERVAKYHLKNINRLFQLEKTFIKGVPNIKPFYSNQEKINMFEELIGNCKTILETSGESIIEDKTHFMSWLHEKVQELNKQKK